MFQCWKKHDEQDSHLCLCVCYTHTTKPTKREGAKYCTVEANLIDQGLLPWAQYCDNENMNIDFRVSTSQRIALDIIILATDVAEW